MPTPSVAFCLLSICQSKDCTTTTFRVPIVADVLPPPVPPHVHSKNLLFLKQCIASFPLWVHRLSLLFLVLGINKLLVVLFLEGPSPLVPARLVLQPQAPLCLGKIQVSSPSNLYN